MGSSEYPKVNPNQVLWKNNKYKWGLMILVRGDFPYGSECVGERSLGRWAWHPPLILISLAQLPASFSATAKSAMAASVLHSCCWIQCSYQVTLASSSIVAGPTCWVSSATVARLQGLQGILLHCSQATGDSQASFIAMAGPAQLPVSSDAEAVSTTAAGVHNQAGL